MERKETGPAGYDSAAVAGPGPVSAGDGSHGLPQGHGGRAAARRAERAPAGRLGRPADRAGAPVGGGGRCRRPGQGGPARAQGADARPADPARRTGTG